MPSDRIKGADAPRDCDRADHHDPSTRMTTLKRPLDSPSEPTAKRRSCVDPPPRPRYCSEGVSSSVLSWLDQLPLDTTAQRPPDMPRPSFKDKGKAKGNTGNNGNSLPPTPASVASDRVPQSVSVPTGSSRPSTSTNSAKSDLVKRKDYEKNHLKPNGIHSLLPIAPLPPSVDALMKTIKRERESPEPSQDELYEEMEHLLKMEKRGVNEAEIQLFFHDNVFPKRKEIFRHGLQVQTQHPWSRETVPARDECGQRVSGPVPDLAYGYEVEDGKFTEAQQIAGQMINPPLGQVTNHGMSFPFFVIEFKSSGLGQLWVAENQCMGASATCCETVDRLNKLLRECVQSEVSSSQSSEKPRVVANVDNTTFSIAMDQEQARLFVTWKTEDQRYYMRRASAYAVGQPETYVQFRRHVRNIIDWGRDKRFREIQAALDFILEEDIKSRGNIAKQRKAPSEADSNNTKSVRFSEPPRSNARRPSESERSYQGTARASATGSVTSVSSRQSAVSHRKGANSSVSGVSHRDRNNASPSAAHTDIGGGSAASSTSAPPRNAYSDRDDSKKLKTPRRESGVERRRDDRSSAAGSANDGIWSRRW